MPGIADIFRSMLGRSGNDAAFQQWYAERAARNGLNPNPDDPQHHYDYRAAYAAGAEPNAEGHWPSQFKTAGHPRMVLGGVNTKTGMPEHYETRSQPVLAASGAVRSSSGAPVTSRFGPAAPVESRNLADLVRVATMPQQPDITGVPLNDAPVVKPFAEPDITGMPLDEGVTVKPFMEPDINPVPLGEARVSPWMRMADQVGFHGPKPWEAGTLWDDGVNRGPRPDISQWLADQLRGH